jgi:alcohol dehydrogenase
LIALVAKDGGKCWDYTCRWRQKAESGLARNSDPHDPRNGTEADPFAVVTNPETNEKIGVGSTRSFRPFR